jgi:hypothetical protein
VLESWNGKLAASGSAPYQVGNINSITYQVVSGVLVTTDLTLTNGANTVNLVATQYLGAAALGSSMLAMTTVAGTPIHHVFFLLLASCFFAHVLLP